MIKLANDWPNGMPDMASESHSNKIERPSPDFDQMAVNELIGYAREHSGACDVLFQAYRAYFRVRLRCDGRITRFQSKVDGSDILQTALIKAFKDFSSFRGTTEQEFSSWLQTIVDRTVIDAIRHFLGPEHDINRELPLNAVGESASLVFQLPAADGSGPISRIVRSDAALRLARAIEELPEKQAEAIALRHLNQMSVQEIAEQMDKSAMAIAGLLKRGTKTLRGRLRFLLSEDS